MILGEQIVTLGIEKAVEAARGSAGQARGILKRWQVLRSSKREAPRDKPVAS
ncbi:MAG TPA: hypothetical protein VI750_12640 [Pyrinomonadaceae bacterium]|nr:hypothetical protein [Pyrinomonadaceae bacterium]